MKTWQLIIALIISIILVSIIIGMVISAMSGGTYREIINVRNTKDLRKYFLLDNPNLDGSDPTGGIVDYSHMFKRDSQGKILPNVNGDVSWQEIPEQPSLIKDYDNGIYIGLDDVMKNGKVGAPRLISRKLFRGGLFIFDVEHCPVGCGVWPAIWLNGFVGGLDQYHEKEGTGNYKASMKKLAKATISKEGFDRTCPTGQALAPNAKPDPHLSKYVGKDVFVAMWPTGGEFDILEQTNFSDTNLISIHGGSLCEVTNGYENEYIVQNKDIDPDYVTADVRSVCGATYWPNAGDPSSGLGPYAGCKNNESKIGEQGGNSSEVKDKASRFNCPQHAATNSGNSQIIAPVGSFGTIFNQHGGGVYAVEWTPKDKVNVWWFPRRLYSYDLLSRDGGPLSDDPSPSDWPGKMFPDKVDVPGQYDKQKVLVASYILNSPNALTEGCDFNFQGITINITLGGGWGGSTMPKYCSIHNNSDWTDYIPKCFKASPERALNQTKMPGVDPQNGCFDGGMSSNFRGSHAKPVFYTKAYFKIRQIRVLQKDGDENIW